MICYESMIENLSLVMLGISFMIFVYKLLKN